MSKIKFVLNKEGVRELLKSPELINLLKEKAQNGANKIGGSGYEIDTHIGKNRANVSIYAKSSKAKKDNLSNNTLLKMLGASK